MKLQTTVLKLARAMGLFAVARALTARRLRILCYHGASLADEHEFRPGLFMTASTFTDRMRYLADNGYPILPLDEAVERLRTGDLPACATVITIDDGWYGTYAVMAPVLESLRFPATLYVSSYYMEKGTQVFNVALEYVLWAGSERSLDLEKLGVGLSGVYDLRDPSARKEAKRRIEAAGEQLNGAAQRQALLRRTADAVGADWATLERRRLLAFMSAEEVADLAHRGMDIQLHTHRHRYPTTSAELRREIEDNRAALEPVTSRPLRHLCYPSGEYYTETFAILGQLAVATGTTTERGMNTQTTPLLQLRRLLDSNATPAITFQAEMSGFLELCRRARARLRPRGPAVTSS